MTGKKLELPPDVARAFFSDVRAYFAEKDKHTRDRIAVHQLRTLQDYQQPNEKKLQLNDIRHMFEQMKDRPDRQSVTRE